MTGIAWDAADDVERVNWHGIQGVGEQLPLPFREMSESGLHAEDGLLLVGAGAGGDAEIGGMGDAGKRRRAQLGGEGPPDAALAADALADAAQEPEAAIGVQAAGIARAVPVEVPVPDLRQA